LAVPDFQSLMLPVLEIASSGKKTIFVGFSMSLGLIDKDFSANYNGE